MAKPLEEVKKLTIGQLAALVHAIGGLVAVKAILGNKGLAKRAAKFISDAVKLIAEVEKNNFFTAILDADTPAYLSDAVAKWRELASDLGYTGPVLWAVKAGFTLRSHAPFVGPCKEVFVPNDWAIRNDCGTRDCFVFFIPRQIATGKNAKEQKQALKELRMRYNLPENHMVKFGTVTLVSGLILAHFKSSGERVPLQEVWVRTDSFCYFDSDSPFFTYEDEELESYRIHLGDFDEDGLNCSNDFHWDHDSDNEDDDRDGELGVFPLAIEIVKTTLQQESTEVELREAAMEALRKTIEINSVEMGTPMILSGRRNTSGDLVTKVVEAMSDCEPRLVHINRTVSTAEAVSHIISLGLQPAKIEHMLALHTKAEIREFPVAGVGVDDGDSKGHPFLSEENTPNINKEGIWGPNYRFLAVSQS